jgi:hypothetical protein
MNFNIDDEFMDQLKNYTSSWQELSIIDKIRFFDFWFFVSVLGNIF